jgi:hypothetical protein
MAKSRISFHFGANRKPRKSTGKKSRKGKDGGRGNKSQAWRAYVGSNAPIPD